MLRIALIGAAESVQYEIDRRLFPSPLVKGIDSANALQSLNNFDAAIIVAPEHFGAQQIEQLLMAGKHVLLAPDRSVTRPLLERFVSLAGEVKVQLATINPNHFLPSRQIVYQKLRGTNLGNVGFLRVHCWDCVSKQSEPLPDSNTLLDNLELCCWIMRDPPDLVYAVERRQPTGEYLQIHLGFSSGAMALIDVYTGLPGEQDYHALSVICSAGAAYVDDHQNMQLLFRERQPQAIRVDEGSNHWASYVQMFLNRLDDVDMSWSIDNWLRTLQVREAVLESFGSGRAISPLSN